MEKQEKAYKGVIEYFKNRIMAGELRPVPYNRKSVHP